MILNTERKFAKGLNSRERMRGMLLGLPHRSVKMVTGFHMKPIKSSSSTKLENVLVAERPEKGSWWITAIKRELSGNWFVQDAIL